MSFTGFAASHYRTPTRSAEQHGWFSDETNAFLGVVIRDNIDDDWGNVVLAGISTSGFAP